jgi:acetyl-CoA acetyltransferase
MPNPVYVIGTGRTDFTRNLKKENKTLRDVIVEAASLALGDAGIDASEIQAGIVGNFASGLFTRQLHLGSYLTDVNSKLHGIPTMHVEGACASGSLAVLTAAQQIMGGIYDVVLVVGAEQQKTMSPAEGSEVLGAAGDYISEKAKFGSFMFPKLFAHIAGAYIDKHGGSERDLAGVAVKNYAHATRNPYAQTRDVILTLDYAASASEKNPCFAPPLKNTDCSQISDGAAALILCSESFFQGRGKKAMKLLGFGHTTDYLKLERKDMPVFSIARRAAEKAYSMAGVKISDLHGAEVHDCFSISEILAYEILGFAKTGEGMKLLKSGATALPFAREKFAFGKPSFSLPVNTGGGLMGDGHPVGATGVRQVGEAFLQLTGAAAERQIQGAQRYLTFNMGGTLTTNVVMIWEAAG